MDPAYKKAAVEDLESHSVWNVPWIQEVQRRFHIETKDLQNLRVCVNLALDKPEHLELVGKYKKIPTYDIDTADICDNNQKYINERLHSFHMVPKKDEELILKGEQLLEHIIRFTQRNVVTNSDAYIYSSINI